MSSKLELLDQKIESLKKKIEDGAKGISTIEDKELDNLAIALKKDITDIINASKQRRVLVKSQYADKHIRDVLRLGNLAKVKLSQEEYDDLISRIEILAPVEEPQPE